MQPSHQFIAVGIGAVVALSPISSAASQPVSPGSSSHPQWSETDAKPPETLSRLSPHQVSAHLAQSIQIGASQDRGLIVGPDKIAAVPPFSSPLKQDSPLEETVDADAAEPPPSEALEGELAPEAMPTDAMPMEDDETPADGESDTTEEVAPQPDDSLEFLDPDPDPLQRPTEPDEVRIRETQPITLEQALELARRNNRELQVAELELESSQAALREVQAALLPALDLSSSLVGQEVQSNNQSALEELLGIQNNSSSNSIDFTLGSTLELSYNLFTSGRRSALVRAAERQVDFRQLQVTVLDETLRLNVTNDYYDLQEADENVRIAQDTLEEALRSLSDSQALERAGVGTRFERLQAEVDVANARQELAQALSQQQVVRRQLVQRLSLGATANVSAADSVAVAGIWDPSLEESIVTAFRNRAELAQQLLQRDISEQQRRAALSDLGPQVALFANYSVQNVLDENDGFSDQYQFGARLNWSLFEGGAARARANQEEANIAIAETNFADVRNQIRFQVEEAYLTLQSNFENIQTASLAVDTARESLRLARLRFQAGVGTQTDVLRSQTELTRAERNLLTAILDYNRSLASLQRSVSSLPEDDG